MHPPASTATRSAGSPSGAGGCSSRISRRRRAADSDTRKPSAAGAGGWDIGLHHGQCGAAGRDHVGHGARAGYGWRAAASRAVPSMAGS
ncbi:hypothetical protein SXCC_03201 [Gluconacetobacter sp. SXCC-1]|nr:hypothetical protein SXCC_03201 [Gluconacetobacter sp. SXCC-1]